MPPADRRLRRRRSAPPPPPPPPSPASRPATFDVAPRAARRGWPRRRWCAGSSGCRCSSCSCLPIVAVVLGAVALSKAKAAPGPGSGLGRAWAGLILGIVGVVAFVGIIVVGAILGWYDEDVAADDLEVGRLRRARRRRHRGRRPCRSSTATRPTRARSSTSSELEGGDEFPGEESVAAQARSCAPGRRSRTTSARPTCAAQLEIYTVYPTGVHMGRGDREIVCLAIRPDGGDLTESVRDSGILIRRGGGGGRGVRRRPEPMRCGGRRQAPAGRRRPGCPRPRPGRARCRGQRCLRSAGSASSR